MTSDVRGRTPGNELIPGSRWRLALILLVILAVALRVYGLDVQSLWLNELDSWWMSQQDSLKAVFAREAMFDPHPQGFQMLLYLVIQGFGDSEVALRGLSVLTGSLGVLAIAILGRQLFDARTGLVAGALVACLWMPLYYAQEARTYATLMLMAIVSTSLLLRILQRKEADQPVEWWACAAFVLSAASLCYLHYFGILAVGFLGAITLLRLGITRLSVLLFLSIGLLYVPWLPSMIEDLQVEKHFIRALRWRTLPDYYVAVFNQSTWLAVFLAAPLQAWALIHAWRQRPRGDGWKRDPTLLLLAWIALPIGVAALKSLVSLPVITNRNLIICLPPLVLLVARGIATLPVPDPGRTVVGMALTILVFAQVVFGMDYYTRQTKEDYRGAVAHVLTHPAFADAPVIGARFAYYYDYYFAHFDADTRIALTAGSGEDIPAVDRFARSAPEQRFWLLQGYLFAPEPALQTHLDAHYEVLDRKQLTRARATLYQRRNGSE